MTGNIHKPIQLEEKMCKQPCKNKFNKQNINMATPEPCNPKTVTLEHFNAAETQENKLKNYFM